jgi:hypothetical protein
MVGVAVLVGCGVEVGRGIRVCVGASVGIAVGVGEAGLGVADAVIVGEAATATDVVVGGVGMDGAQLAITISANNIRHSKIQEAESGHCFMFLNPCGIRAELESRLQPDQCRSVQPARASTPYALCELQFSQRRNWADLPSLLYTD